MTTFEGHPSVYFCPTSPSGSIYPVSFSVWSTFMNTYAVWLNPGTDMLYDVKQNVSICFYAPYNGSFVLKIAADIHHLGLFLLPFTLNRY